MSVRSLPRRSVLALSIATILAATQSATAQQSAPPEKFSLEQIMGYAFPYSLVSADRADRLAWISNEKGLRNVYTATPPDYRPIRLTHWAEDDGVDLQRLQISADGSTIVFIRGHGANRAGWVANPSGFAQGVDRSLWAVSTDGGDAWRVTSGTNGQLAPDGSSLLVTSEGQVRLIPVSPNLGTDEAAPLAQNLFVTQGEDSGPVWSPDGSKIAFTSTRPSHSFIGVFDLNSRRVSYLAPGVDRDTAPRWSPDGNYIAFTRTPGKAFAAPSNAAGGRGGQRGQRRGGRGAVVAETATGARRGGRGRRGGAVVETSATEPAVETREGLARGLLPGGAQQAIMVVDVHSGDSREVWNDLQSRADASANRGGRGRSGGGIGRGSRFTGASLVFAQSQGDWRHTVALPFGGEIVDLTPGEGMAETWDLSKDGEYVYYSTNVGDIDRRHLWRTSSRGGATTQLTFGTGIETDPAPLATGREVAILYSTAKHPRSVAIVPADGGEPRVIFPILTADYPLEAQVEPFAVELTAADGVKSRAQVFVPNDIQPGEKRPAMLFTHGGPSRQMLVGYHYMDFYHQFYAYNQHLVAQGYIVISVNYRGGIGYGDSFQRAPNRGRSGNSEYQDVMAGAEYMLSRDDVDPNRFGLWGLSYGGLLTAQGLARNSDIFCAGVDLAGVHSWGSDFSPDNRGYASSPISEIEKWTSPVLLVHGDDDRNVNFSQTVGLVQLLRANDVHHELIVFPDDVHESLLYSRWLYTYEKMNDFLERFVINRTVAPQAGQDRRGQRRGQRRGGAARGRGRGRGAAQPDNLVWVNRDGTKGEAIGGPHRIITGPTISPDGKKLAVREGDGNDDIFVYDLASGTRTQITSDEASDMHPQWTADGENVAFFTYRNGLADIYIKTVGSDDPEKPLANGPFHEYHPDFTPDGKSFVFHHHDPDTDLRDIWTKPLAGGDAKLVVSAEGSEGMPRLSKDGKFMAYQSNESGEYEVYVVAFPSGEGKVKVSTGGGNWPRWGNEELFFFSDNTLMAVTADTSDATIKLETPIKLFTTEEVGMQATRSSQFNAKYGVSPDGQRFLIVVR